MATLTRVRSTTTRTLENDLDLRVPAPFPTETLRAERVHQELLEALASEELDVDPFVDPVEMTVQVVIDGPKDLDVSQSASASHETVNVHTDELLSSLAYVQQSCLMTMNNLLSGLSESPMTWQRIVPPRRHSMPSRPEADLGTSSANPESFSSALQTLVSNLRGRESDQMIESSSSPTDDVILINELRRRVDDVTPELSVSDARLAQALVSLLAHTTRLSSIDAKLVGTRPSYYAAASFAGTVHRSSLDVYDELSRQVMDLRTKRLDQDSPESRSSPDPHRKVEISLLWSKIDEELDAVSALCRERSEPAPRPYSPGTEQLPPEYDYDDEGQKLLPPQYEASHGLYTEKEKQSANQQSSSPAAEKMRMDFEAVTMAIDRLYLVAPQLHNQRVELRKGKLEELERARLAGPSTPDRQKGKEKDVRELDRIVELIGKASSRRMDDQSVSLEGDMRIRIKKAKERDDAKREAFVEHLITHSHSRRINSQDAVFQSSKVKDGEVLLTLPEFIREQVPEEYRQELERDPEALLTLPEAIKEPPPAVKAPTTPPTPSTPPLERPQAIKRRSKSFGRSRSISAPPLAWLISFSSSRSLSPLRTVQTAGAGAANKETKRMTVRFVAEHHESLHHVLVFLGVDEGMVPGVDLEGDVLPGIGDPSMGDKLLLRCGSSISAPLDLPVQVTAGKADVRVQGGHYEIKFPTPHTLQRLEEETATLLDAAQVSNMDPTSFICASCSLPLVQPAPSGSSTASLPTTTTKLLYRDLPSEHWSELLEAWMCHHDQKLHEHVARHGKGFWPKPGQAFVGGSYFLFDESAIMRTNIRVAESTKGEDWLRVQCICGAVIGRCKSHSLADEDSSTVFRVAKYALRPVSPTTEPLRVPFSAFILEDMMEFVHAHATYRFVILDEEEERPRLLIWLFKPYMRLAYATTAQFALPKSGSVNAAKVLFKILGPDTAPADLNTILNKHPGFPQAERLLYPIDICHRLAALLKESNTSYPHGMRVMTGLLVGWLRRS